MERLSGSLGGVLGVVNIIGGLLLFLLVGKVAWRKTSGGRAARIFAGALVLGAGAGWSWFKVNLFESDDIGEIAVVVGVFTAIGLGLLEGLRRELEGLPSEQSDRGNGHQS